MTEKIKGLRSTFSKHLKTWTDSKKSGASADDVATPSWRWFPHLQFLSPHIKIKKVVSTLDFLVSLK